MGPHEHIVRDALREDCSAIAAIYNEGLTEGRSTFETEPRTAADINGWLGSPRHPVLIAEHDGEIAGWARIAPYSTRPCYVGIGEASIYVQASARAGVASVTRWLAHYGNAPSKPRSRSSWGNVSQQIWRRLSSSLDTGSARSAFTSATVR